MNEWSFFFVKNGWIKDGRIIDVWHHQVESEWMSEVVFCSKWLNPRWQNSRCLTSSSWVRMNEWSFFLVQNGWIQDGRIQDVWHHQVESEWISLRQSLVQNCWIQDGSIQDDCHHKVGSEWMSEVFLCSKWMNPRWQISRWLTSSS